MAAQDTARRYFAPSTKPGAPAATPGAGSAEATTGAAAARSSESAAESGAESAAVKEKIANLLGFATYAQAEFAINQIVNDEDVNRLRVYATAAHSLEWSEDGGPETNRMAPHSGSEEDRAPPRTAARG